MEHVYYEQGYSEAELNVMFPTEERWLATCGPDVDLEQDEAKANLSAAVDNMSGLTHIEFLQKLMNELHQLSVEARNSRAQAAKELSGLFPDSGVSAEEIETNLSKIFSAKGWHNLWGSIKEKAFQIKDDLKDELMGRSPKVMKWD